jgi:TPR repeat protein
MRRFHSLTGVLSISDDERNKILQQVEANDPVACFKQAQIYRYLHNCDDYVSSAHELLKRASESGIADADAAIAIMMFKGEIEPYNPPAAAQLLEKLSA